MAEEDRQRQEGTAAVIDADKSRVRNDVKGLLAAVIGMGAPADVGEQTGGMTQPLLVRRLVEAGRAHGTIRPADQFLAMHGRARAELVELARGGEEWIAPALLGVEQRIEQALAHAERRND